MKSLFKDTYPFEHRRSLGERFRQKFPGKIPVIVERSSTSRIGTDEVKKYVIPSTLTFGHLYYLVRNHLSLRPEDAVILFVKGVIPASGSTLGSIYESYHDEDLFLYVVYQDESVYGACEDLPSDEKSPDNPDAEEDNQGNQENAEGGPPPSSTGGDAHNLPNGNSLPVIRVFPPSGNSSATGPLLGGASNAPSTDGLNANGIVQSQLQVLAEGADAIAHIIAQFYIANRNLVQTVQLGLGSVEPTPTVPQMDPSALAAIQPPQSTPEAVSNVNVSSGEESEVPTEGNTSDLSTENADTSRGPNKDAAAEGSRRDDATAGVPRDDDATAGPSGDDATARVTRDDATAGGPSGNDATAGGPSGNDATAGGPIDDDATAEGPIDDDATAGEPRRADTANAGAVGVSNRDTDAAAASAASPDGDSDSGVSGGIGFEEASATDSISVDDSGAVSSGENESLGECFPDDDIRGEDND